MEKYTRRELGDFLSSEKQQLTKDVMFITSFRATKDNTIQVEVCQNRELGGRTRSLLGLLNRSDSKFRDTTTLLFDWMTLKPKDFVQVFPESGLTVEQLEAIAKTWTPNAPTGKDAIVHVHFKPITKLVDVNAPEDVLEPVIIVTEVTESQLRNGEFFRGSNAEERIEDTIDNERNIMKTGATEEDEYLVDPETGDKVYRFTRTLFKKDNPQDSIIPGKITMSAFNKRMTSQSSTSTKVTKSLQESLSEGLSLSDSDHVDYK